MEQIKTHENKQRILRLLKRIIELIDSESKMDRNIAQGLVVEVAKEVKKL